MSEDRRTLIDLHRMRRHYADFRAAWARGEDEPAPRQSPTMMTIAAVLAAEDLGVLLDYLDAKEVSDVNG